MDRLTIKFTPDDAHTDDRNYRHVIAIDVDSRLIEVRLIARDDLRDDRRNDVYNISWSVARKSLHVIGIPSMTRRGVNLTLAELAPYAYRIIDGTYPLPSGSYELTEGAHKAVMEAEAHVMVIDDDRLYRIDV